MARHGGIRKGAGRKPKAKEVEFIEKLDNIIDSDEAVTQLKNLINQGNFNAIKLYLEYRYGKPKESVDVTSNGEGISFKDLLKFGNTK